MKPNYLEIESQATKDARSKGASLVNNENLKPIPRHKTLTQEEINAIRERQKQAELVIAGLAPKN